MRLDKVVNGQESYDFLVDALVKQFGEGLKTVVLFGSQSREEARPDSDHDIFVVVENLPADPLARQREIMIPLLPFLLDLPERLSIVAKTAQELLEDVTPLVIDICMDGISLYGAAYFAALQARIKRSLREAGLQRRRLAGTWMWMSPTFLTKEWEISWEEHREHV